jgi:hypothetical protein
LNLNQIADFAKHATHDVVDARAGLQRMPTKRHGLRHRLVHAQRSIARSRNFVRWILVPLALGVVGNASILKIRRGTL